MTDLNQAIAANLRQIMGSTQLSAAQPTAAANPALLMQQLPQGYTSAAALVINTQDEIARELEQRLRSTWEQLEDIALDVQMATVKFEASDKPGAVPVCLLDCQQVASRADRLGRQVELLRADLDRKGMARFYDQLVADELYAKLDSLRARQEEIATGLQELTGHWTANSTAAPLAAQLLELERCRVQLQAEYNSAQAELEEATGTEREQLRLEISEQTAELLAQLREHYRSQLTALGARFATDDTTSEQASAQVLAAAKQVHAQLQPVLSQLRDQCQQLIALADKLAASLRQRMPSAKRIQEQLRADKAQLQLIVDSATEISEFDIETESTVTALDMSVRKLVAVMSTLWPPGSDPMTRWCSGLRTLEGNKASPEAREWLAQTPALLCPLCKGCSDKVLAEYGRLEAENAQLDRLCRQLRSCETGVAGRQREAENQRFRLNAKYEADKHQLGGEARRKADSRLARLNQQQAECRNKNRGMLDARLEQLKQNFTALRYHLTDATSLTEAKELAQRFIADFSQLQSVDDEILTVESELAQLRRAKQKAERLRRTLGELQDLYARTQDIVSAVRPTALLAVTKEQPEGYVFTLQVEVLGVQPVDEDVSASAATLELRVGRQSRAVTVPIGEDFSEPVATLSFKGVTQAATLSVDIKTDRQPAGSYELSLQEIDTGKWIPFPLAETSQQRTKTLEPLLRLYLG
jgi:hypothetical protein